MDVCPSEDGPRSSSAQASAGRASQRQLSPPTETMRDWCTPDFECMVAQVACEWAIGANGGVSGLSRLMARLTARGTGDRHVRAYLAGSKINCVINNVVSNARAMALVAGGRYSWRR
jgi:hypothetical protein